MGAWSSTYCHLIGPQMYLVLCTYQFFPADGNGGDKKGIRPQTNPKPQELDTSPKPLGEKLDTSYPFSKLNS